MPSNKTSIEVEAKGEFSQLTRGLRDVKSALGEVTKVVNTGARSGGFFSDEQLKSLDIFGRRFSDSMNSMNRLIDAQGEAIASLYKRRREASSMDITAIDKEIKKHGDYLDALEKEREEMEKIYGLRRREASEFGSKAPRGGGSPGSRSGGGKSSANTPEATSPAVAGAAAGLLGLGRSMKGIGGFMAGLAGVALSINQLMKWEQMAEQNIKAWQPIIQRTGMNRAEMQSVGQSRGYDAFQTSQALDVYTHTAGRISSSDAGRMMDFSRGYGVDVSTSAGIAGQMAIRGYGGAGDTLDRAAGVAEASNMQDRIVEVLETSQGFLQSMDKNLKDNTGNSLLAYTARINQIGKDNGATKLTGQAGASMLEQMGSNIFNPSNVRWQTMGINMLSRYGGEDTKKMDSFELMKTWQQGFQNPTNMKVLGEYLENATKGMNDKQAKEYKTLTVQEAMGGGTTIEQAEQFGQMTNWLKAFNPNDPKMKSLLAGGNGDKPGSTGGVQAQNQTGPKAALWKGTLDAQIEISNAALLNEQLKTGEFVIPTKLALQDFTTDLLSQLNKALEDLDIGNIFGKKLREILGNISWWEVIGAVAATAVGGKLLKFLGSKLWDVITKSGGGKGGGGAATIAEAADDVMNLGKKGTTRGVTRGTGIPFPKQADALDKEANALREQLKNETDPAKQAELKQKLDANYQAQNKAHKDASDVLKNRRVTEVPETVPGASSTATKGVSGAARIGGKLLKGVPLLGGAIDVGMNKLSGQSWGESITRGLFSTLGGLGGGALGSFLGPVGTVAGGIGGGMAGDMLGQKVYRAFAGDPEEQAKKQAEALTSLAYKGTITLGNLSDKGVEELADLSQKGLLDINGMKSLSLDQVKELREQGVLEVTNLSTEGAKSLMALDTNGEATLGQYKDAAIKIIDEASAAQKLDVNALSTEGQDRLKTLQENGEIKLGKLNTDGTQELTVLNTEGSKHLADLQSQGLVKLGSMDDTTTKKLDEMAKTHKELKDDINKTTATGWGEFFGNIKKTVIGWGKALHLISDDEDKPKAAELMKSDYKEDGWKTRDKNDVMYRVAKQLSLEGKSSWFDDVQKLMTHENQAWDPNPTPNPIPVGPGQEHAQGLFQFLPSTWKSTMGADFGDTPGNWSPEVQTQGLIKYIESKYGSIDKIPHIDSKNGSGPSDYHGYADGAYVAKNQTANIHAGEEIISRAKTGEVQRKTGKLPSQVLNDCLATYGEQESSTGSTGGQMTATAASSLQGGTTRIVVDVNLNGAQALQGLPIDMIERVARQVFADAAYQAMRPQVQF